MPLRSRGCFRKITGCLLLAMGAAVGGAGQTLSLPPRAVGALTGSQFITLTSRLGLAHREAWIYNEILAGNIPNFLRTLVPINVVTVINGTPHSGTYYVTPDYVAVGTDSDYFLQPMTPLLGQRLCDALGCTLPTRKMVNQIWTNAPVKLAPQTIPPSAEMITVPVFAAHNSMVRTQRNLVTNSFPLGALVSGDKKDVILSTKIYTNFANAGITKVVVIYGWHSTSGAPIQNLYNGHEETYADYSHGIRLVQNAMLVDGSPSTVTNVLSNASLAGLLSDEGAVEATTNGVIAVPRYTISPLAPMILTAPRGQTVGPGGTVQFSVFAVGKMPLSYRWQFNGATIAGATNSSLSLTNVQGSSAGFYNVVVTNAVGTATARPAQLRIVLSTHPVLYSDDFEIDTSAKWNLFWGASNGIPDYTAQWSFDYSLTTSSFNGVGTVIPPAPNSPDGATRAVRLTVNNNDTNAAVAAVNIYARDRWFNGNYALKFDLWLNYPGGAGGTGGSGTTQHAIFGLGHLGTQPNWATLGATASDGIWFAADGEGDDSRDYRAYVGNLSGPPIELIGQAASGLTASNNIATIYQTLFPATRFETAGSPGKNWVEVEIRRSANVVSWFMDGTLIAQRTNELSFSTGTIMLGLMDVFNSIASPASDSFVLFDNVRVEDLSDRIRFLGVSRQPDGQVHLELSAVPGKSYLLEGSVDLSIWQPLATAQCTNGPMAFVDSGAGLEPRRFYRARQTGDP